MDAKTTRDEFGNIITHIGDLQLTTYQDGCLVTIICSGNEKLYQKLCDIVREEYGETVRLNDGINGFGENLGKFFPNI